MKQVSLDGNPTPDKIKSFRRLEKKAASCRLCPSLADQPAVLSSANGSLNARIVFLAEAPGRFGAGRTGVPFQGDRSGDNFEILLKHIGLTRSEVFITNAVLCNPLENGNNRKPTAGEIKTCSGFLQNTLGIIQPRVVVTLGTVALQSLNKILGTRFSLKQNVAQSIPIQDFTLFPLYHPSPRVTNWKRPLVQQKKDFKKIPLS
ncbi:MAG: uracil-DNA glycosylase [Nitrospina sp.]|jgi:DNA polymerase|nr:uracil-DNA glycosylase [Nitrospina sp.]MBT3511264.1 uracil-DNA glycosylase [Nitrospina sp.]MBT3877137.1 uracil-DNA glycosylase [Nitrospina sp.]MBT4047512.1 uracil-DNA glycosylase [Nitrospina sp.]MBT4558131.1 uracil-DNA glycosylase [Nitrospina sp.]